jgi:hypothetical protein
MKTEHADRARGCVAMKDGPAALRLLSDLLAEPSDADGAEGDGAEGIAPERRARKGEVADPLVMQRANAIDPELLAEGRRRLGLAPQGIKLSAVATEKPDLGNVVRVYLAQLSGNAYVEGITMLRNAGLLE